MNMDVDKMQEKEVPQVLATLGASAERLSAAAALLEKTIGWLEERHVALAGEVHHVVASVETPVELLTQRNTELERRLEQLEHQIAGLRAEATTAGPARKTLPSTITSLLAKQGIHGVESIEAGTLDAALTGLSLEQRIAVKSQLLRAGALV